MLTDKSGRLFKSIEGCVNTTIRGLPALISPEAGCHRRAGYLGFKDGAGSCRNPGLRQRGKVVTCLYGKRLELLQGVLPPLAREGVARKPRASRQRTMLESCSGQYWCQEGGQLRARPSRYLARLPSLFFPITSPLSAWLDPPGFPTAPGNHTAMASMTGHMLQPAQPRLQGPPNTGLRTPTGVSGLLQMGPGLSITKQAKLPLDCETA